jgi:hypothetical protein
MGRFIHSVIDPQEYRNPGRLIGGKRGSFYPMALILLFPEIENGRT